MDELIDDTGDNRQSTYLEPDDTAPAGTRRIWRASGLGACDRSLVMGALGYDQAAVPAAIQTAYDAGHATEHLILAGMKRKVVDGGWRPLDVHELHAPYNKVQSGTGQVELELDCGTWRGVRQVVRCHPDQIAVKVSRVMWSGAAREEGDAKSCVDENGTRRVVEAKFLRPTTYGTTLEQLIARSKFYAWQFSVEMAASGLGLLVLVGWKQDKTQELEKLELPWVLEPGDAPYTRGQIKGRVLKLAQMVEKAELEGLGAVQCDWPMYPCGYYESGHMGQKVWEKNAGDDGWFAGLDSEHQKRITYLAGMVEQCRVRAKEKDAERKKWAAELQEAIEAAGWVAEEGVTGQETRVCAGWKVTRVVEPAKEARMVEFKASAGFEYVKVQQVKGAGNG